MYACDGGYVNAPTLSLTAGKPAKSPGDTPEMAQSLYNCYLLIKRILSDPSAVKMMGEGEGKDPRHAAFRQVMVTAQATYVACFHAFYPTSALKWLELCSMLSMVEPVSGGEGRGGTRVVSLDCVLVRLNWLMWKGQKEEDWMGEEMCSSLRIV